MDNGTVMSMFNLVESLSRKEKFKGPELTAYLRGLTFVENYFELNTLMMKQQINIYREEEEKEEKEKMY